MTENSFISNYSFTKTKNCFGITQKRLKLKTADGKSFSVAAANHVFLPRYIKSIFWARVTLADNSQVYINKNSLAKRINVSNSYVKSSLRSNKDFDNLIRILSKIDDISKVLKNDEQGSKYSSIQIVEKMEKNREKYLARASEEGSFVKELKCGRTLFVIVNPETGHTEFYITLHKLLGSGGFKSVHALLDYNNNKANFALSVQEGKMDKPKDINMPKKGLEFTSQLEESKRIQKVEFYLEKGVNRDESGELIDIEEKAKVYVASKRYSGTFNHLVKSDQLTFQNKILLFSHILEGVSSMHAQNILHRDLKFENVLYKKTSKGYKIKIIDFDLSCYFNDEKSLSTRSGTLNHMAPEVLGKEKIKYPEKVDSWSLGIMLYMLCEKDPAFIHGLGKLSSKEKQVNQILSGVEDLSFKKLDADSPLIPVIQGLLDPNPETRMKVDQALEAVRLYLAE